MSEDQKYKYTLKEYHNEMLTSFVYGSAKANPMINKFHKKLVDISGTYQDNLMLQKVLKRWLMFYAVWQKEKEFTDRFADLFIEFNTLFRRTTCTFLPSC